MYYKAKIIAPFRHLTRNGSLSICFHILNSENKPSCGSDVEPARRRIKIGHIMCGPCMHQLQHYIDFDGALDDWNERFRRLGPNFENDNMWRLAREAYDDKQ